jgi:hypothetical protein
LDKKQYLINWLEQRKCLSLRCLELQAEIPNRTLSHLINTDRNITENNLKKLLPILIDYGFNINEFNNCK